MLTVNDDNFQEMVSHSVAVLDFHAMWCRPCHMLTPILEKVASQRPHVKFGKVNIDECQKLAEDFGISAVPTLVFFKDGEAAGKLTGIHQEDYLLKVIDSLT